jgi:AcrR family transcriptional regulator
VIVLPGDFKQTHEKILNSAKRNFLAHGYERANLRKICKDADVTNGAFYRHFSDKASLFAALVEPAVQGINEIYIASEEECLGFLNNKAIDQAYQVPYKVVADFINYIYDDFDCFKLLLMCSDGTKYINFVDDMVILEVNEREKLYEILKKGKIEFHKPRKEDSHLLTHSYFSSIFEVVTHDFTKEEALEYAHTLVTFYNAGWRAVLGI